MKKGDRDRCGKEKLLLLFNLAAINVIDVIDGC